MLLHLSHFFSPFSPQLCTLLPPSFPHLSSCQWVIHKSYLASPFPILFLTFPVYFVPTIYASYSLYLLPNSPPSPPQLIIDADPSPQDPCCGCNRQIHMDYGVLWRKRDGAATLSRGERLDPCLERLLLFF